MFGINRIIGSRGIMSIFGGLMALTAIHLPLRAQFSRSAAIEATIVRGDEYATYTLQSATGHLFILKTIKNTCCVVTFSPPSTQESSYLKPLATTGLENMKTAGVIPSAGNPASGIYGQLAIRREESEMTTGIALVVHYN